MTDGPTGVLWLIGMMGAGKSAVGRIVASRQRVAFVDTDDLVEANAGVSISELWAEHGEADFREREANIVAELALEGPPQVVATGGGSVLRPESVAAMRSSGLVVWLEAPAEVLAARLPMDGSRPLLGGAEGTAVPVATILARREDLYRRAAHRVVHTAGRSLVDVAGEVRRLWNAS